jgi:hypothetical protein
MYRNLRSALQALCFMLLAAGAAAPAFAENLAVGPNLPAAAELGAYTGTVGFVVGEVKDATFAESTSHVGMGPQSIYEIVTMGTRADTVREGVTEAFRRAGLLAATPGQDAVTVDVTVRRMHSQTHMTFGRFRLRSEIFLEFAFHRGDAALGRVLAAGNAQEYAQIASEKKYREVYQVAFNDAIHKVFNSRTLAGLAGAGWAPAPAPAVSGDKHAVRIMKDEFYGPTDWIQGEVARAAPAMQAAAPAPVLLLPDFELDRVSGKKNSPVASPAFAKALLPELIREHLDAFFPGAFAQVQRAPAGAAGLTVAGDLEDFRVGNFYLRNAIGFGAGKDKLEGTVAFKDAGGQTLHEVHVLSSNWGAGWQTKRGNIRDMADQLARDVAYFLVKTRVPDYRPPADLEVLFDATPYPMPQRKS